MATFAGPPKLAQIDASAPLDKIYDILARDGGVIVTNFLSSDLLKEVTEAIEPHFAQRKLYDSKATHSELGEDFFPEGSQRVYGLLGKCTQPLIKILRTPIWQGVMNKFLR